MKKLLMVMFLAAGIAVSHAQTSVYDWTYIDDGVTNGSGTITIQDDLAGPPFGGYVVTAITGTDLGDSITGLDSFEAYEDGFDQRIISTNAYPYVDAAGIEFNTANGGEGAGGIFNNSNGTDFIADNEISDSKGEFTITPVTAPEPSCIALAGVGVAGLLILRRKA